MENWRIGDLENGDRLPSRQQKLLTFDIIDLQSLAPENVGERTTK